MGPLCVGDQRPPDSNQVGATSIQSLECPYRFVQFAHGDNRHAVHPEWGGAVAGRLDARGRKIEDIYAGLDQGVRQL